MNLLKLLIKLAENVHHKVSIAELVENQPILVREALLMNKNTQLRNILGGNDVNFPDRDKVVTIER